VASLGGKEALTATFQIATTGASQFRFDTATNNHCSSPPASARLFFAQKNYTVSGETAAQYQRWWSNPVAYVLAPGTVTLTASLNPAEWSSVYGVKGDASRAARAGFSRAMNEVGNIGLTFGGGCFFGHGVAVSGGTARFILTSYRIR
jgi:hypothetical protein